jgi:hypothetical protein
MSADTVTPPVSPPAPARRPSRLRRWLRRLLPPTALLALALWFAPAVVAKTALRNRVAREALAGLRGSVEVGSASLGWLSPVELRDVTIKDGAGRTLATVPRITSAKSLLELARNKAEPGEFTLESPALAVVCERSATNLEAAFAEFLKGAKPDGPTRTPVAVRVTGGTLTLTDAEGGRSASIAGIDATATVPASRAEPVTIRLTAATGALSAELSLADSGSAALTSAGFPLESLAPLLKRAAPGLTIAGALSSDLRVAWGRAGVAVAGRAGVKQFALSAPPLNGDTLRLDSAELPLDVELVGRALRVRKFDLACDVGTLSATGTFDPGQSADRLLTQPGVSLRASVELAKLAGKLPRLLRVKDGTELREGRLEVKLASRADAQGVAWDGSVRASALKAVRGGKPINWDEPLSVEFLARHTAGELPAFDRLVCSSDFIAVNARTTPGTVQAAANVYLRRLAERLGEFIDLGGATLDGEASATLVGRRAPDGAFRGTATLNLKDFAFTDRAGRGLKEPALKLEVSASGTAPAGGPVALKTASAALAAGGDELNARLLEPVADVRKLASGAAELRVSGDLARWKSRVGSFVTIPPYQVGGSVVASGKAKFAPERITVDRLAVSLKPVKFRGAGLSIDEPGMIATGDFTLTRATNTATIAKFALTSAPLSVKDGTLTFEFPKGGDVIVSGSGPCACDLNRLGAALKLSADPRGSDAFHGRAVGPLRFRHAGDVTTFGGALDVTDFALGPEQQPLWSEPKLRLEADGDYRDSADAVTLAVAKVERPGLALDAKGSVGKVTTAQDVNVAGTLRYDWAKLTPLVRQFLGEGFAATGNGTRAFAASGQLTPPETVAALPQPEKVGPITLKAPGSASPRATAVPGLLVAMSGEAALGWETLHAHGFDIGAGELRGRMARGVVAVSPVTATFGGGKVTLAPTLRLDIEPGEVSLAKGAMIDHAKLTPKATAGALGYALPAIANATQAEGEISASVADNRFPLDDPTRANAKGTLVIHKATVGAGPVASEVAKLLGAKATTMTLANESTVPVQVAGGRVYHQNFTFKVGGTTLHTSGSVGFDQTLDLVVDVPLPKELPLLKNNPLLAKAVAGKSVKVPVKGTLAKPAIDARAFERAVMAMAREGARGVGKELLDKELNKLLPGIPAPGTNPKGGLPFTLPFGRKP